MIQSWKYHYEVLGCFLQWRISTKNTDLFTSITFVLPLKSEELQDWLQFYQELGLLEKHPALASLQFVDIDDVEASTLDKFVVIFWPSADDPLLSQQSKTVFSRSIAMCHYRSQKHVPAAHLLRSSEALWYSDETPVVVACHQGMSVEKAKELHKKRASQEAPLSFCVVGNTTDVCQQSAFYAANGGASLYFMSRRCDKVDLGILKDRHCQNCVELAPLKELIGTMLVADAVLVLKNDTFIKSGKTSGCIGTCIALLVPFLIPKDMSSVFPQGKIPAGCAVVSKTDDPVQIARKLLETLDFEAYAKDRDRFLEKNVSNLDTVVLRILHKKLAIRLRPSVPDKMAVLAAYLAFVTLATYTILHQAF